MSVIQRASDMENLYADNPDPWKNRERGLYNILMKELVEKVMKHVPHQCFKWCEIGAGGANVMDGILHNLKDHPDRQVVFSGVDMSESALEWIKEQQIYGDDFALMDLEEYLHDDTDLPIWHDAAVISWVEVLYYFGDKRPWKASFDEFWKGVRPGSLVVMADSLVPYQYRDYLKKKEDAELLESYTDYAMPVSTEVTENGKSWTRYLKVRIFKKLP